MAMGAKKDAFLAGFFKRNPKLRKYFGIPVEVSTGSGGSGHQEASQIGDRIVLYPKFFNHRQSVQDFILIHEIGHWVLSLVGLKSLIQDLSDIGIDAWDTSSLPFAQSNMHEAFADSFASYFLDGDVKRRYPKWAEIVKRYHESRTASGFRVARLYLASRNRRYFHGTSSKFLPSIRSKGILGSPPQTVWNSSLTSIPGHVYLTTDIGTALDYADKARRKFGGDRVVLVVYLSDNDPRVIPDEDVLVTLRGNMPQSDPKDIRALWDFLKTGRPDPFPDDPGALASMMMQLEALPRSLDMMVSQYQFFTEGRGKTEVSALDALIPLIERNRKDAKKKMEGFLSEIAMTAFAKPDRVVDFLDSKEADLIRSPEVTGTRSRAEFWAKYHDQILSKWPDIMGTDAVLSGRRKPDVAVRADRLVPSETWVIPEGARIRSYSDLIRMGIPS